MKTGSISVWAFVAIVTAFSTSPARSQASNPSTLARIEATKTLKVCIWPDYFGISYRNPRTGDLQGIDIDLSQALARDLKARVDYVLTDFSRVLNDVEQGRCDIAMMAMGVTPERAQRIRFSEPYLRSDVYAIATRANPSIKSWADIDRPGRVVVVQKGTYMEPLMQRTLRSATLRVVDRPSEREREVESGQADVFITDYPYSKRMLKNTDWARVIAPTSPVQTTDYAYAVAKGDSLWLDRVNLFVRQIKIDGRLLKAAQPHELDPIVVKD